MKKILGCALCFFVLISCLTFNSVNALDDVFPYEVYCSNNQPSIGSIITIRVALTDYKNATKKIRGLQIDMTNIDKSVFEVVEHKTLINETNVASNTTSYSESNSRVRLVYAKSDGTLDDDVSDLMEVKVKIKDTVTMNGSISIPITLKIQTVDIGAAGRITQKTALDVNYHLGGGVFSADIQWGKMMFEYTDGVWNPTTHKYENGGWNCNDEDNLIKVSNNGNIDISATYDYVSKDEYSNIVGTFKNSEDKDIKSSEIKSGQALSVYLQLSGNPTKEINEQSIGTVKIELDEVVQQ